MPIDKRPKITLTILERAARLIPSSNLQPAIDLKIKINGQLGRSEFESALESMAAIADLVKCPGGFWRDLERAALFMELKDQAKYFRTRFLATKNDSSSAKSR